MTNHHHRSWFINHCSWLIVHRSSFIVHHSSFIVHRSSFINHRSSFINHHFPITVLARAGEALEPRPMIGIRFAHANRRRTACSPNGRSDTMKSPFGPPGQTRCQPRLLFRNRLSPEADRCCYRLPVLSRSSASPLCDCRITQRILQERRRSGYGDRANRANRANRDAPINSVSERETRSDSGNDAQIYESRLSIKLNTATDDGYYDCAHDRIGRREEMTIATDDKLIRGIRRWDLVAVAINGIIGFFVFGLIAAGTQG